MDKSSKAKKKVSSPRSKTEMPNIIENIRPKISISSPGFSSELEVAYSDDETGFTYRNDNGVIKRVLNIKFDSKYEPDKSFTPSQEWLINNRQGDDPNRLPERILDQRAARKEEFGMVGASTLNNGIIWGPIKEIKVDDKELERHLKILNYTEDFQGDFED